MQYPIMLGINIVGIVKYRGMGLKLLFGGQPLQPESYESIILMCDSSFLYSCLAKQTCDFVSDQALRLMLHTHVYALVYLYLSLCILCTEQVTVSSYRQLRVVRSQRQKASSAHSDFGGLSYN